MKKTLLAVTGGLWISVVCLPAGDVVYQGEWNGNPVELHLQIAEPAGSISGLVTNPGSADHVMAAVQGRRLENGSLQIALSYRFEELGTYLLKPLVTACQTIWQTDQKDLWFGPPLPETPESPVETR